MTRAMTRRELMAALDDIGWAEQATFEASERPDVPEDLDSGAEERLRELARSVTPVMLDQLERQPGYLVWALRLSPLVAGDASRARAERHAADRNAHVRYWAARLLEAGGGGGR